MSVNAPSAEPAPTVVYQPDINWKLRFRAAGALTGTLATLVTYSALDSPAVQAGDQILNEIGVVEVDNYNLHTSPHNAADNRTLVHDKKVLSTLQQNAPHHYGVSALIGIGAAETGLGVLVGPALLWVVRLTAFGKKHTPLSHHEIVKRAKRRFDSGAAQILNP